MKLIIQIPCYNEEDTLGVTLKDLPKKIPGIDSIEILVINDGSTDKTSLAARNCGVGHTLELPKRKGLAEVFRVGIRKSLKLGADIIVNTDADNQYPGKYIEELVKPILEKKAEMVIGCRNIHAIKEFSLLKKLLQRLGSYVVRRFSGTNIPDVTSGFRAYSRDAAMRLNIFSSYTYTLETIIQAGRQNIPLSYINIEVNAKLRESRLIKNIPSYIIKSTATIVRIYLMYEPLKTFFKIGLTFMALGSFLILRFFYFYFISHRSGHAQSLIIASLFMLMGFGAVLLGMLGDIISANRKLNEETLYLIKKHNAF